MAQVGLNRSFTDQNTKGLPRNWFYPRRPWQAAHRTQGQAGQAPWSQSSALWSRTPDPRGGRRPSLPTVPLTRFKHLVIWNQNSIFPFYPYNVLLRQTYFGKSETFTKVEITVMSPHVLSPSSHTINALAFLNHLLFPPVFFF